MAASGQLQRKANGGAVNESYLHGDARHSLTFTTDTSGAATDWFLYNSYGLPLERSPGSPDYGFMGSLMMPIPGFTTSTSVTISRPWQGSLDRTTLYSATIYRHEQRQPICIYAQQSCLGLRSERARIASRLIGLGGGFFGTVAGIAQTIDGSLQKNALSAVGVGATTTVGGISAASAGASGLLKYYRARVNGPPNDGGGDGGNQDGRWRSEPMVLQGAMPQNQDGIEMDQLGGPGGAGNIRMKMTAKATKMGASPRQAVLLRKAAIDEDDIDGLDRAQRGGDGNADGEANGGSSTGNDPVANSQSQTKRSVKRNSVQIPEISRSYPRLRLPRKQLNDAAVCKFVLACVFDRRGFRRHRSSLAASTGKRDQAKRQRPTTGVVTEIATDTTVAATGDAFLDALPVHCATLSLKVSRRH